MPSHLHRVALGAIFTECNELGGVPLNLDAFQRYELRRGAEILAIESGVAGGMISVLQQAGCDMVPLLYASTGPGGPLTADCYGQLKGELLDRLRAALPVDGVILPLHGAASAHGVGDLEGDLIAAVRQLVGPAVPIIATLDLHAHVTEQMVFNANALVAWETYPHADAFSTGQRGARLLLETLDGHCRPTMAMAKVPVITGAIHGSTQGNDPFARLMRQTKALENQHDVLSTSLLLVHPYLDQPQMGSGGLVITDGEMDRAVTLATELAAAYWAMRFELEPTIWQPAAAIAAGRQVAGGPILLVETADCAGGGAAGDSVATLVALLAAGVAEPALVPVVDPAAAALCQAAGVGATVTVSLGHGLDDRWGVPIPVNGRVTALGDGHFRYRGGIFDGVDADMGPSAVLAVGSVQVLIMSHATYEWQDEQFLALGLDPRAVKFLVVKNPMNYRMTYGDVARATYILDTPGPTPATIRRVQFQNLQRPYFPLDAEIPDLQPTVLTGWV